jgi:hypothetical protein
LLTAKGSIVAATAANAPAELPVGTNGQILMACSTPAAGLRWQTGAIGPWINIGTIQTAGWNTTSGQTITPGAAVTNDIRYRQLGPKEYEVIMVFNSSAAFSAGSGNWLFRLPAGLNFDTSLPWQAPYTSTTVNDSNRLRLLPGLNTLNVVKKDESNQNPFGGGASVYNATQFRIFASAIGQQNLESFSSSFYGNNTDILWWNLQFRFTAA